MKDIAIVYMVAGISSRFGGKIKQFAKVGQNEETLIEISLKQALSAGFNKIIFITGEKTEKPFKEKFGNEFQGVPVHYAYQTFDQKERDRPWGTCDAVSSAQEMIGCPFVVCNGDDLYGKEVFKKLYDHLKNHDEEATVGYELDAVLPETGTVNRGIIEANEENYVKAVKEFFNISRDDLQGQTLAAPCSMNIFALQPKTLSLLSEKLKQFKQLYKGDRKKECLIQDMLTELINEKKIKMKLWPISEPWIGVTNPGDEEKVKAFLKSLSHP